MSEIERLNFQSVKQKLPDIFLNDLLYLKLNIERKVTYSK